MTLAGDLPAQKPRRSRTRPTSQACCDDLSTQVVFADFVRAETFSREHFQGFARARVVTYSASMATVLWLMDQVTDLEVIMGDERLTASLSSVMAYQHLVQEELLQAAKAGGRHAPLLQRIRDGSLRVRVLNGAFSHAKMYLLEGERCRRIVVGSANLSERALPGAAASRAGQHEQLVAFDDHPRAWKHYHAEYERLRAHTRLLKALPDEVQLEHLPLLENLGSEPLVLTVPVQTTIPQREVRFERLRGRYAEGLAAAVTRCRGRKPVLEARQLPALARLVRGKRADAKDVLRLDREGNALVSNAGFRIDAQERPAELEEDAALLVEFFEGYTQFSGEGDPRVMQRDYFAFLCWLYVSPFMADLLTAGMLQDQDPHSYPLFAVLMGKSSSGKTTAAEVFLRSMLGPAFVQRAGQQLGKVSLRGMQAEAGRLPVYFNDVEREKLRALASDIKNAAELHTGGVLAPIVMSLNGNEQGLEDELRKRLHLTHTGHALDPTRLDHAERRALGARALRIRNRIGTALYAAYLFRLLPILDDPERLQPELGDPLRLSSRLLGEVLRAAGQAPAWAGEVTVHRDKERALQAVRAILRGLWEQPGNGWILRRDRVIVPIGEDRRVGAALLRGIPDSMQLAGCSAARLVLEREALERLMGLRLRRWFWKR